MAKICVTYFMDDPLEYNEENVLALSSVPQWDLLDTG